MGETMQGSRGPEQPPPQLQHPVCVSFTLSLSFLSCLSFHFPFPMHSFRILLGSNFNATSARKPSLTSQTR